jgi:hypothetical protein
MNIARAISLIWQNGVRINLVDVRVSETDQNNLDLKEYHNTYGTLDGLRLLPCPSMRVPFQINL